MSVLLSDTSGAESLHRCDSGGEAMKRRGRRIECVAKFCDEGGDLLMRYETEHVLSYNFHYNLAKN